MPNDNYDQLDDISLILREILDTLIKIDDKLSTEKGNFDEIKSLLSSIDGNTYSIDVNTS